MEIRRMVLAAALVSGLGAAASGQGAGAGWEKMAIPDGSIWQDATWPPVPGESKGPVLAADRGGRLYVNNGPKLHIGSRGGSSWTTLVKSYTASVDPRRALAAGETGTVQWGEWRSRDGGATWDSTEWSYATAFGILADGAMLHGLHYDGIERSEGAGGRERVHSGRTYGYITRFAVGNAQVVVASPSYDALMCSIDSGRTWDWGSRAWPAKYNLTGRTVRALDFENSMGSSILIAVKKNPDGTGNRLLRLTVFYPVLDSISWNGAVLPDSAITALHVGGDGSVWLGTSGQGVWTAASGSRIFTPGNGGLDDMHVSSLAATSDGRVFALTRDGVYRARYAATGLRPTRPSRSLRPPASVSLHIPGHPGILPVPPDRASASLRVLADGRAVSVSARPSVMP